MTALFAALGVDYAQWKALTIAALKIDLRTRQFSSAPDSQTSHTTRAIFGQLFFYLVLGAFMAFVVSAVNDLFVAALIVLSYVLFMVGMAILLDHNSAVTSPADYAVLGFQPISSRTWFAARLTNVLVYTLAMTTAVGALPAAAFFIRHGAAVGVAALVALYTCAFTVTLAIILAYVWIMRWVGERRLRSLLSYVQLVTGFVVYGGYFLIGEVASKSVFATLSLPKTPWLLLYPATWFASYLELAAGRTGATETLPALASVVLLGLLVSGMRGRLSLAYAEQLGAIASAADTARTDRRPSASRPPLWFRGGEARAMAILVAAQFRNDLKFRMSVLAVLPLTVVYLFVGLRGARDGGSATGPPARSLQMVTVAIFLFPAMLKMNLARSDAFRASWIFFASPASRSRLIRSGKNVLVAFFLLPYLACVGVSLAWLTGDVSYIALYVLMAGLLSHLVLLVITLLDPEMPFSQPVAKGRTTTMFFLIVIVASIFSGVLPVLLRWQHGNATRIALTTAMIVGISLLVDRMTRVRVDRQAGHLEFQG